MEPQKNRRRNRHRKREEKNPWECVVRITHTRMAVNKQKLCQHEKYDSERNKLALVLLVRNKIIMQNFKAEIRTDNHRKGGLQQKTVASANRTFPNKQCYCSGKNRNDELRNMLVMARTLYARIDSTALKQNNPITYKKRHEKK